MGENISEDDIHHIEDLARLRVSDDQVDDFKTQFNEILERFARLDEVDLDDVGAEEFQNVLRDDEVGQTIDTEQFMSEQDRGDSEYFEN